MLLYGSTLCQLSKETSCCQKLCRASMWPGSALDLNLIWDLAACHPLSVTVTLTCSVFNLLENILTSLAYLQRFERRDLITGAVGARCSRLLHSGPSRAEEFEGSASRKTCCTSSYKCVSVSHLAAVEGLHSKENCLKGKQYASACRVLCFVNT